jgi:hypothetical protein
MSFQDKVRMKTKRPMGHIAHLNHLGPSNKDFLIMQFIPLYGHNASLLKVNDFYIKLESALCPETSIKIQSFLVQWF